MLIGNLKELQKYNYLPTTIRKALEHAQTELNVGMDKGRHDIDGEQLYLNRVDYKTTLKEERFWEAHKQYIDVHVILEGEERIDLNFVHNLEMGTYQEESDYLPLEGEAQVSVVLKPYDFLICFEEDGHMTGLRVTEESSEVKKAIYKVKID